MHACAPCTPCKMTRLLTTSSAEWFAWSCRGRETWQHGFVPLEEIITRNLDCLFAGMEIESAHTFRVTRNAELDRQETRPRTCLT